MRSRGNLTVIFIVAATALAACADLGGVAADGDATTEVVDSRDEGAAVDLDDEAEAAVEPVEDEPEEAEEVEEPEVEQLDLEIAESGFSLFEVSYDDSTRAAWGVLISNPNDTLIATSVDVTVTFLDENDGVIGSTSDSLAALLPGQTAALADSTYEDVSGLADLRVQVRARGWEEADGEVGSFVTSGVSVRPVEYGGWTVTGSVESTFVDDFEDVYAVAVLRDADGAIVGGAWTFVDFVPGGGDTSFQIDMHDEIEAVASADVHFRLSNLSLW